MLPTKNEVTAHVNKLIIDLKAFAIARFDANVNILQPNIGFRICDRLGRAGRRNGVPFMKLNMGSVLQFPVIGVTEYKSYAHNPAIGGFVTNNWKDWVDALVLHEFAHVLQFELIHKHRQPLQRLPYVPGVGYSEAGHGAFFQKLYGILRDKFLNDRITPLYGNPERDFDNAGHEMSAAAKRIKRREDKVITVHPYIGKQLIYKGIRYEIKEVNLRNRKYPYIGISVDGKRLKVDDYHIKLLAY